jgi:hypothetical protein
MSKNNLKGNVRNIQTTYYAILNLKYKKYKYKMDLYHYLFKYIIIGDTCNILYSDFS